MQTIVITGINRGIGEALAKKFLAEGHYVVGTSPTGSIEYEHENLGVVELDLSKVESISQCVIKINNLGKKISIIINNAAVLLDEEETHVLNDKLRNTLDINLIGTIDFTERLISSLDNNAHIINISSSAGAFGAKDLTEVEFAKSSHFPFHYPAYKISKAALNMYTKVLAARFINEKSDIVVSSVHPGWVKTDMGGPNASMSTIEAANYIYETAISRPETGQFWFRGEKYPW